MAPPSPSESTPPTPDLDAFTEVQQLAYACVEDVGASLAPGVTEREAARRLRTWLTDAGVVDWFHTPFAWFGDRTAFRKFRTPLQFFPTDRPLADGMPFILDVAPVVDGAVSDVGYAAVLGENPLWDRLFIDLAEYRPLIPRLLNEGATLAEVYRQVDALAARHGFDNRHRAYPGRVLAHRVEPVAPGRGRVVGGFGLRSLKTLVRSLAEARGDRGEHPLWNDSKPSEHRPEPGLWAVEPHLGYGDVGVKFEELLVVDEYGTARWLDDDLPHVRRWNELGVDTTTELEQA